MTQQAQSFIKGALQSVTKKECLYIFGPRLETALFHPYDDGVEVAAAGMGEAPIPAGRLGRGVGPGIEIPPGRLTDGGGRLEIPVIAGEAPSDKGAGEDPIDTGAGLPPANPAEGDVKDALRAGRLDKLTGGRETLTLGRPGTLARLTGGKTPEIGPEMGGGALAAAGEAPDEISRLSGGTPPTAIGEGL